MKIRVISPNTSVEFLKSQKRELKALPEIEVVGIKRGPRSLECFWDDALAAPRIIELVREAEKDHCDAIVISCFFDPGLAGSREVASIPVTSAGESSLLLACSLGHKISVLTTVDNSIPVIEEHLKNLGLEDRVVSIRPTSIPVLELRDTKKTIQALLRESLSAVKEDHADVLVLGCTGMAEVVESLRRSLKARGVDVPVIDPLRAAIEWAKMMIQLKLSQSRSTYQRPPKKERTL